MRRKTGFWMAFGWIVASLGPTCAVVRESEHDVLTIGAYSVVREAVHDAILPAFAAKWERETGREVRFEESYNASGAQARAIAAGFDADVALLSLEGDVDLLVKAGLVEENWKKNPTQGMISRSLVVVGVRGKNPRQIADWSDLARPGVKVLYPDPKTSGGARWNVNAIYGSELLARGKSAAKVLLARVQKNVVTMDTSGRQSMATFSRGTGDAVVTYENELLLQAKMTGHDAPYVIPASTLLIESPGAIVGASVDRHKNRRVAEAFLAFLTSPEGQQILADYGFRPLDPRVTPEPAGRKPLPPKLFTMKRPWRLGQDQEGRVRPRRGLGLDFRRRQGPGEVTMGSSFRRPVGLFFRSITLAYLGVMVALPLTVLAIESARPGVSSFIKVMTSPVALHALKLTFVTASVMVLIDVVMGTATAWVLVRYPFHGKGFVNALIDLPFAVPTIVTGVMLVALYGPTGAVGSVLEGAGLPLVYHQPGIVLALLFVTYPFVIRSVQPVLMELEAAEEEAAATLGASPWTTFRRVTLPTLRPAILTGAALSFSRALGEFGSVVMVAGNRPMSTKTAPMYIYGEIEGGRRYEAVVVSTVLLACSLGILIGMNLLQRRGGRTHGH